MSNTYSEMAQNAQDSEFLKFMALIDKKILVVNRSSSKCGTCGLELIYINETGASCPRCGSTFSFSVASYSRVSPADVQEDCERLAPKLQFLGYGDIHKIEVPGDDNTYKVIVEYAVQLD